MVPDITTKNKVREGVGVVLGFYLSWAPFRVNKVFRSSIQEPEYSFSMHLTWESGHERI